MAKPQVRMMLGPGGRGEVLVDGVPLRGVVGVRVDHDVAMAQPEVLVWFNAAEVEIDMAEARAQITPKTKSLLVKLGWTPPTDDEGA